jgi:2'-5' RNA ligase
MENFDVHTDYPDFNPHMTIAYMKKGKAEKYKKEILDKIDTIKPYGFNYSYSENGKDKNEYIK